MPPPRRILEETALRIQVDSPSQQFIKRTALLDRDESLSSTSSSSLGSSQSLTGNSLAKCDKLSNNSWSPFDLRSPSPLSASSVGSCASSSGFFAGPWDDAPLTTPTTNAKRDSFKPRNRFSLPTIQELKTYERDPEFAKLSERPKRGLNLPRSQSLKPSAMSAALQEEACEDDGDTNTEDDMPTTPSSLPSLARLKLGRDANLTMSPMSDPGGFRRAFSESPPTPLYFDPRVVQKSKKKGFFFQGDE